MKVAVIVSTLALGLLGFVSACGSEVLVTSNDDARTGAGSGTGAGGLDPRCYEDCIRKGGSEAECAETCWSEGQGSTGPGAGKPGSGSGTSPPKGEPGSGGGDEKPGEAERNCYECMKESAGACAAEYEACEKSLACTVLAKCPYECWGDASCVEQCNSIIPSGVELLTALVDCMMCGPYTVCAEYCEESSLTGYCSD